MLLKEYVFQFSRESNSNTSTQDWDKASRLCIKSNPVGPAIAIDSARKKHYIAIFSHGPCASLQCPQPPPEEETLHISCMHVQHLVKGQWTWPPKVQSLQILLGQWISIQGVLKQPLIFFSVLQDLLKPCTRRKTKWTRIVRNILSVDGLLLLWSLSAGVFIFWPRLVHAPIYASKNRENQANRSQTKCWGRFGRLWFMLRFASVR